MSFTDRLYLDVHILQTVPPSCVNRDDTGSPKTAVYGGVRRARVSSQAWKRAVRVAFRTMYEPEELSSRTKRIVEMVASQIRKMDESADAEKKAVEVLKATGLSINEKDITKGTEALFFMSEAQAAALAKIVVETPDRLKDKEYCKAALSEHPSVDMALFGRMVASDPSLNYDAAAQVAHAISTHAVQNEFDYFTAVDDKAPEDSAGAGHLGTVEFNSSTLYRYATVNVNELRDKLAEETPNAVRNFLEAFICSMPTGKQNTFANRTFPDAVYVTVRRDQPINMAGAFEKPVLSEKTGGYVAPSAKALKEYAEKVYATFAEKPAVAWSVGDIPEGLAESVNLKTMLETVEKMIRDEIGKDEA